MQLTVFTPAYNRAALLPRLYESLLAQESGDFEWLVVDDGSTDDTPAVIRTFAKEGRIPVRYIRQENGGKHTAHNCAVQQARGDWFFCVDSDDWLAPGAVEHVLDALRRIEPEVSGLVGRKADQTGRSLCAALSKAEPCRGLYSLVRRSGGGEYALLFRTEVLREYSFPVIPGERFMTECVLYDRLELAGNTVCPLNEMLEICEYQPGGLSSHPYRLLLQNPGGYQLYHGQRIDLVLTFRERLRHCVSYQAFRSMSGRRGDCYRGRHRLLAACAWLPGQLAAVYYQYKGKRDP